jgi:NAD(P)-dependent dehydrogenase (short-subunit alcohol dehydrogenase family)
MKSPFIRGALNATQAQLAVVTGAPTGIGLKLTRLCAQQRWDLIIAAASAHPVSALLANAGRGLRQTSLSGPTWPTPGSAAAKRPMHAAKTA